MNWNVIIQRLNELTAFKNNVEANSKKIPQLPTQTDGTKFIAAYNETSEVTEKFNLTEALAGLNTLTDGILEQGLITRDENVFTFETGFQWRINGIDYANAANIDLTIEDATTDFYRIDIAVVDTNNLIYLIQGIESDAIPLQPQTPNNTLLLCVFNVFGNSIEDPLSFSTIYKEVKLINFSEPYTLTQPDAVKYLVLESSYDVILPTGLFENPNFEIKNASGSSREITFDSNIVFIGNPIIPNGGLCLLKKIKNVGADEYWSVNVVDRESGNSEILEQWRRLGWSAGAISGFGITNNGDGTANIATGNALLRTSVSEIATLNEYVLPALTNQTFTDNTTNYVYANYNSGTPIISVTTDSTLINTLTTTLIYGVVRQGTNLYYQSFIAQNVDSNGKLRRRFIIMETFSRGQGAIISGTNRKIAVTSGSFFSGLTPITTPAFDTNVASTFTYVYFNGTNFTRTTGQTDINNTQYVNAGTLTTMSNNNFRTDFVYLLIDNPTQLWVVQGNAEYGNLALAKSAPTPTNLPPELNGLGVIVGRVIIEKSATTLSDVASPFTTQFIAGSPTLHNQLGGLQGGASNEYYHLSAQMYGYLDLTSSAQNQLDSKEFILSAGTNISIDRTNPLVPVISASGGGGGSQTLDETLTNGNTTEQSATFGGLEVSLPSPALEIVGVVYEDNFNSMPLNAEFSTTLLTPSEYNITTDLIVTTDYDIFNKSITLVRQQALDSWKQEITFKPTDVTTTSYGIGLGIKSVSGTIYPSSLISQVFLHDAGDGLKGKIRLYKIENTSEIISTSATGLAFSENDILSFEMKREVNVFTFTFKNITLATELVHTQTYDLDDTVLVLPNTGQLKIYFFGGTYEISNYKYTNLGFDNSVIYIGDSITTGYFNANFSDAYIDNVSDVRNWNYFGGQADRSLEIKNALPQILQNNPKYVVVFIGTNDALFAYTLATYKSNLEFIIDYLIDAGITPYLITPCPTNTVDTSTYVTACLEVATDFAIPVINTFNLLKDPSSTDYNPIYDGDGIHPNALGHSVIANAIKSDFPLLAEQFEEIEVIFKGLTSQFSGIQNLVLKHGKLYVKSNITPEYTDNADAKANGLLVGDNYRTGDDLKVVH